jgi:hypothetical protein
LNEKIGKVSLKKIFRADRTGLPAEKLTVIIAPLKLNIAVLKLFA